MGVLEMYLEFSVYIQLSWIDVFGVYFGFMKAPHFPQKY